jgi:hypothetical protein
VAKTAFKTVEQEVIEKVGENGILQSKLTNTELMVAQRLSKYGCNSTVKPKFKTILGLGGPKIVPYKLKV